MGTPLYSKLLSVKVDSSTWACTTDFSLSMKKDVIETACMSSSGAKTSVPDMYGWSVSGSGLVFRTVGMTAGTYGMFDAAASLLNTDASVLISIVPDVSLNKYYEGAGFFTSLSMEGGTGKAVTYSYEITGTNVLSIKTTG